MKTLLIMLLTIISYGASAQTSAKVPLPQGKTYNLDAKSDPKDPASFTKNATKTTNKAIYGGVEYPVWVSKNDKLFVVIQSKKSGNYYRRYLQP